MTKYEIKSILGLVKEYVLYLFIIIDGLFETTLNRSQTNQYLIQHKKNLYSHNSGRPNSNVSNSVITSIKIYPNFKNTKYSKSDAPELLTILTNLHSYNFVINLLKVIQQ